MKRPTSLILGGALAALAAGVFDTGKMDPAAAGMDASRLARIPARMKEFVTAGKTAGVVTLVARHGHVASLEAVGYQDLETKTPMRTDSIFRIASLTKPVTCAGVMILVDEGRALADRPRGEIPAGVQGTAAESRAERAAATTASRSRHRVRSTLLT